MKKVDYSETIADCDLKLIDLMKICEYLRSRSFIDLGPRSFTFENSNLLFSETTRPFLTKFCMSAIRYMKMKTYKHDAGHMTKMAAMPIFGKNPSKIFFSGTSRPISTKLGM